MLVLSGALEPLDHRLADYRSSLLNRQPSGQIAIVEIDAKSIAAIKNWPWARSYHARLIRKLHAAGASIIAFDVDFSSNSDLAGDKALAEALHDVEPVILPVFEQRASTDDNKEMIRNRPAAVLGASWVGEVNIIPGSDGVVREFPAATMIGGQVQPSMAALLSDNSALQDRTFIPDWSIDARRIPRMSFIDVLDGKVPVESIRGKRVIVGATAIELGDHYTIPRFGTVPGVVVQALAADSLLQHRALSRLGLFPTLLWSLLIIVLLVAAIRSFAIRSQLFALAILLVTVASPVVLEAFARVSIDAAVPLTAALLAVAFALAIELRHIRRLQLLRDRDTGLPNSHALYAFLTEAENRERLGLTAAGIDRFETIRSILGNKGMTSVMNQASCRLEAALKRPVYQIAPDVLAWLSWANEDGQALAEIAESQFEDAFRAGEQMVDVRCTMGVARLTDDADASALVERSLTAIHLARSLGTNRHSFQSIAPELVRNLSIMGDLRRGIETGEVFVAYQPKLNLKTGNIDSAEALVRWKHPVEGLIAPDRFISLAEETGEIRHLTRFVLKQAMVDWQRISAKHPDVGISVNVSTADIGEPEFADQLEAMIANHGMDAAQLTIEITESAIIKSQDTALKVLGKLRKRGIRLSIDDYGTGQSTLSYLKKLPVNELKIDKLFVTSILSNESDRIMVRSTIDLAHELGLKVVAEGAEDLETVSLLKALGCDHVQGYAVGKAVAPDAFLTMSGAAAATRKVA